MFNCSNFMEEVPPFVQALRGRRNTPSSPVSKSLRFSGPLASPEPSDIQQEITDLENQISEFTKENDQIPHLKRELEAKKEATARREREHNFLMISLAEEEEKVTAISEQIKQIQSLIDSKQSIIDAKNAAIDSLQKEYTKLQTLYKSTLDDLEVQRINNSPRRRPPPLIVKQEDDYFTYDLPKPEFPPEPEYNNFYEPMEYSNVHNDETTYARLPSPVHAALRDNITFQDDVAPVTEFADPDKPYRSVHELSADLAALEKQRDEMESVLRRSPPRGMTRAQAHTIQIQTQEQLEYVNQSINRLKLLLRRG